MPLRSFRLPAGLTVLILLLCGCGMMNGFGGVSTKSFQVYVDGALEFSLKIPPDWQRDREPPAGYPTLPYSRWWQSPATAPTTLLVQAPPAGEEPATADDLLAQLQRAFPQLTFAAPTTPEPGAPQTVTATGPDQTLEGLLLPGTQRHYTAVVLLPTAATDEQRQIARALLQTFRPLAR